MKPLRVLIVDDSVVMRRIVREVLSSDPDIEVAGVAANGRIGLAMLEQVSPDAITLDIEMPEMDGLEMLKALRPIYPKLRVIIFSALSERGATATLDALALGADDYVTKPSNVGSLSEGMERIRLQLIPKLKALCWVSRTSSVPPATRPQTSSNGSPTPRPEVHSFSGSAGPVSAALAARAIEPVEVLAIGTSTGGPNALTDVIPWLPADLKVPVVIVQHMPPTFTKFLAQRLSAISKIPVVEATAGDVLEPGKAWIAPGDFHMTLRSERSRVIIETNQEAKENSCRPSVDVLFRSVAQIYGARTLALIMTGMGQDGLRGCELVREEKGQILAQDEGSSVVWGMPGFVVKAGLADDILALKDIGPELVRRIAAYRHEPVGSGYKRW